MTIAQWRDAYRAARETAIAMEEERDVAEAEVRRLEQQLAGLIKARDFQRARADHGWFLYERTINQLTDLRETDLLDLQEQVATLTAERPQDLFAKLLQLPENWDSYGAARIDPAIVERAKLFLSRVNVVPCSDGSVQLEWHTHGLNLEIEFTSDGKTEIYARAANETAEIHSDDAEALTAEVARLQNMEAALLVALHSNMLRIQC